MKTIGLIGGLNWHSTIDYYRIMNQQVNERAGNDIAPEIILYCVNFGEIKKLTRAGDWTGITRIISAAAKKIDSAGADC